MNFNIDPVAIGILTLIVGGGYRAWDSLQKAGKERLAQAKEMHEENKEAMAKIVEDKERAHTAIHVRLNGHGERISKVEAEVNAVGFRVKAVEDDIEELKEER